MQNKSYATQDEIDSPREIEYHRWSVIRWISHCVSWNKSFPAEGYRMQRISIRESCHVFSWWFCQLETIDKDVYINRSMEYIGNNLSTVLWNWKALIATRTVQCCNGLRCAMKDSQRQIVKSWIQELSTGTTWKCKTGEYPLRYIL
jgi:hypothetical protein